MGSPLAIIDQPLDLDMNVPGDVTFTFEIGLQPEINVELNKDIVVDFYNIGISDEMVDRYLADIRTRNSNSVSTDVAEVTDRLVGTFVELENGEPKENGITKEASLLIETVKDEELKDQLIGLTVGASVVINPMKAFENAVEVSTMLSITVDEAKELTADFSYTISDHYPSGRG